MHTRLPKSFYLLIIAVVTTVFSGCGRLDNLDTDQFSIFKDEINSTADLRRYGPFTESETPIVEYLVDFQYKPSIEYRDHLKKMCDYAKLPFKASDVRKFSGTPTPTTRVLCVMDTKMISQQALSRITDFVASGGTVFFPFAAEDRRIGYLFGFRFDSEFITDVKSAGYLFTAPVIPGLKDIPYNDPVIHFGYDRSNFTDKITILATATSNKNYPLVIENRIGRGKVVLFNTTVIFEKIERGLMFAGMLKGLEGVPYPIVNASTMFLDDFPSPLYNIKSEPIASEMDLTVTDFVKEVWWPDMIALAKKYKMEYAAMIAFDYKNKVNPPFIFDQWEENKLRAKRRVMPVSDWLVHNVAQNGHELALHGYNHVSLRKELWKNQDFIETSMKAVLKKWEISNFGPLPTSYVPPSNIIDKDGVRLLKKGMPSLKFMCSLYLGERHEGGDREFDFDPYNKDFFDYPRISDGFYLENDKKFSQQGMYLYTGIWTHFVHPDDVYQIQSPYTVGQGDFDLRNKRGIGWRKTKGKNVGMFTEFDQYLREMTTLYPQMRFVNADKGGTLTNDWRASRFTHEAADGKYTVSETNREESITQKQYWFLYGSAKNAPRIEALLNRETSLFSKTPFMDGHLYTIYTHKPEITVRDLFYKSPKDLEDIKLEVAKVRAEARQYEAAVALYRSGGGEWVDDSAEKLKAEMAYLKAKMLNSPRIDPRIWNRYAQLMVWEDKGDEVWKLLDEHVARHRTRENIAYAQELNKTAEFPSEAAREKWHSALLEASPGNREMREYYVSHFDSPDNQARIRAALEDLRQLDKTDASNMRYIAHLLAYDRPAALAELRKVTPSESYRQIAADATWLFADEQEYDNAYSWSKFADEVDYASRMYWLIETGNMDELEKTFNSYIAANPNDFKAKAVMAGVLHEKGMFRDAWAMADSMAESPEKKGLREMLNKDVIYVDRALQQDLLANLPGLFLPEVRASLEKDIRLEGPFIALTSAAETNRDNPSAFKNVVSYNFYDKSRNLHSIGATYSSMYDIELPLTVKDLDNRTHAIGGLQYQFNNKQDYEKLNYWGRARVEYSDYERLFYQLAFGANISRKGYKSAEFRLYPAETGPAHSKRIYRMQLNVYQDYYLFGLFNASLSLEGNYYTPSKKNSAITTKQSLEGSATAKITWDDGKPRKSIFLPFVEGSVSQASMGYTLMNLSSGYPYWLIDNRLFGGGGLGWKYGLDEDPFNARVEAAHFFDDYTGQFQRYSGKTSFRIFGYTAITASFEIYAQSKFYSNNIQFGVKHFLGRKKK